MSKNNERYAIVVSRCNEYGDIIEIEKTISFKSKTKAYSYMTSYKDKKGLEFKSSTKSVFMDCEGVFKCYDLVIEERLLE
jgi:hypothetical protein